MHGAEASRRAPASAARAQSCEQVMVAPLLEIHPS
jgi:hypothetical protein